MFRRFIIHKSKEEVASEHTQTEPVTTHNSVSVLSSAQTMYNKHPYVLLQTSKPECGKYLSLCGHYQWHVQDFTPRRDHRVKILATFLNKRSKNKYKRLSNLFRPSPLFRENFRTSKTRRKKRSHILVLVIWRLTTQDDYLTSQIDVSQGLCYAS